MENKNSMKQDLTGMIVLVLLNKKDMYGYELAQLIEEKSGMRINIKEGTLYPSLYKLKQQGCISSYNKVVGPNESRIRVYYRIEEKGKEHLSKLLPDYVSLTTGIQQIINWAGEESNSEDGNSNE